MDESDNMTCNQVPEPKSIANLIDELLNVSYTSVSSKRNFSKLTNWQICELIKEMNKTFFWYKFSFPQFSYRRNIVAISVVIRPRSNRPWNFDYVFRHTVVNCIYPCYFCL